MAILIVLFILALTATIVFYILWSRSRRKESTELERQRLALDLQHSNAIEYIQRTYTQLLMEKDVTYAQLLMEKDVAVEKLTDVVKGHALELQELSSKHKQALQLYKSNLEIEWQRTKRDDRAQSNLRSRSALVGKIAEHMTPALPDFKYNIKEARHVGELFDFMIFDGLEDGHIKNVVFMEVKTGRSYQAQQLNPREKLLREAVDAGRVKFEIFIPSITQED